MLVIPVRELHNDMLLPVNKGGFEGAFYPALRQLQDYHASVTTRDETLLQKKAADAPTLMTCPNVGDSKFPLWNCVLGNCAFCPLYQVPWY